MAQRGNCQVLFSGAQWQDKREETLFYCVMAECWYRLFREVKDSPILEVLKISWTWLKRSPSWAEGLDQMNSRGSFQPQPFSDLWSVILIQTFWHGQEFVNKFLKSSRDCVWSPKCLQLLYIFNNVAKNSFKPIKPQPKNLPKLQMGEGRKETLQTMNSPHVNGRNTGLSKLSWVFWWSPSIASSTVIEPDFKWARNRNLS